MHDPLVQVLRQIQIEEDLSNAEFSKMLGIDFSYWWMIVNGKRRAGRKVLDAAVRAWPERSFQLVQGLAVANKSVDTEQVSEVAV